MEKFVLHYCKNNHKAILNITLNCINMYVCVIIRFKLGSGSSWTPMHDVKSNPKSMTKLLDLRIRPN